MRADFWSAVPFAIIVGLVCVFATLALFEARVLAARAKRMSRALFPPPAPDNVIDIEEARERARFTKVLGPADERRIYRSVQTLRVYDSQKKGFRS